MNADNADNADNTDNQVTEEDAINEDLVAYLDGELNRDNMARIEDELSRKSEYRLRLKQLQQAWDLMDDLPQEGVDETFIRSTVELVVVAAESEVVGLVGRWKSWRPVVWIIALLGVLASAWGGFLLVNNFTDSDNQQLLNDLPLVQEIDIYDSLRNRPATAKLEIRKNDDGTLSGKWRSTGATGKVSNFKVVADQLTFDLSQVSLRRKTEMRFAGKITDGKLTGQFESAHGKMVVSGTRSTGSNPDTVNGNIPGQWDLQYTIESMEFLKQLARLWGDDTVADSTDSDSAVEASDSWRTLGNMTQQQRAQVVRNMQPPEKEKLRKKWEHFKGLDEDAKVELREFHQEIVADSQADHLRQVMILHNEWLGRLRFKTRAELLSLPSAQQIREIQLIMKEEEARKFAELLEKKLPAADLRSIPQWVESFLAKAAKKLEGREEEIISGLTPDQQKRFQRTRDPRQRRRFLAAAALFLPLSETIESKLDFIVPTKEDFQQLRDQLSSHGQELFDQAGSIKEQKVLIGKWSRAAWMSRNNRLKRLPEVSDETLEDFRLDKLATEDNPNFKLKPEDRERLERLSGDRLKEQLKWYYHRYRGDLEPGGGNRVSGRGSSGRGSNRSSSGGRRRPLEQDKSQFIDRPLVPSRSQ